MKLFLSNSLIHYLGFIKKLINSTLRSESNPQMRDNQ